METEKKLKILQMFYAGALADSALRFTKEGVIEKVTAQKKIEQLANGNARAIQLGIQSTRQVFDVLPEIFGCADWKTSMNENGFDAVAKSCILCGLSKKAGSQSPCNIYCLDAMEGIIKGLDRSAEFDVISTLWDGIECKVRVKSCE